MIDISKSAIKEIKNKFAPDSEHSCVRIMLAGSGCGGPNFKLESSTSTNSDDIRQEEKLNIVVEKKLIKKFGPIQIQYVTSHWGGGHIEIRPLMDLSVDGCGDCRC